MFLRLVSSLVVFTVLSGCTQAGKRILVGPVDTPVVTPPEDPYLFLEDRLSPDALAWVKPRSEKTIAHLTGYAGFSQIRQQVSDIKLATDRLAFPVLRGEWVYNFWSDKAHPKGVWRRMPAANYAAAKTDWEELVDVAELAKAEKTDWVWKGEDCLAPAYRYCLVNLSDGGEDAVIVREFDTQEKKFRTDGITLPKAKHTLSWWDENTLLVATDFGAGSLTKSGYPRIVKKWKRGTPIEEAELLIEGKFEDVSVAVFTSIRDGKTLGILSRVPTFFEQEFWSYSGTETVHLPLPADAQVRGVIGDVILVSVRKDWKLGAKTVAGGSLVSLSAEFKSLEDWETSLLEIYRPDARSSLEATMTTKNFVLLQTMTEVKGKLLAAKLKDGKWEVSAVPLSDDGMVEIVTGDDSHDEFYIQHESFVTPPAIYRGFDTEHGIGLQMVAQLPARYDSKGIVSEQRYAKSKDGTHVPYFVVRKASAPLDGSNPTLMYGYGGFEVSITPRYLAVEGKTWLEKGGIYVIANIRGGGEFGPQWHESAILENRQRAYDDFIAVAQDLIQNKFTSPRRLGIRGGSNGGLLVGAVTMQRPDLFNAVVCQVPLLDMVRYQELPPGDSWSGEYGSATDPVVGPVIRSYSPYQNIRKDKNYPNIFFWSSVRDDRVQPGHARKMVARMEEYGHKVLYYESQAGGHGGSGDIAQAITDEAMAISYLFQQLMD